MAQIIRSIILALALMAGIVPAVAQSPTPVPPLPDTERRTSYTISNSTCACAVGFAIYGDGSDYQNWVEVWVNGARAPYNDPSVGWTLSSPTISSFSSAARPITNAIITFNSAQTGTIQIVGARKPRRVSQYSESRGVPARSLNQDLTDIVAMLREDWDKINDVSGRAILAPPGETLNVLASAAARASSGACFDASGNLVSCVSIPSTTFTAGNGIAITGTSPKTITNNIQGTGPITVTGTNPLSIGCPTCNTSPAAATPAVLISTRAAAAALDLHTFSVVKTAGYTTAGDYPGSTFKNIGSNPFLDTNILTGTVSGNGTSGCTTGTYYGTIFGGGATYNGTSGFFIATVVVAGGVVTSITQTGISPGYVVGDVLSASITGCSTTVTFTVATISTPLGSFTDSAGTHWQIIMPAEGIDARAFGAKFDWTPTGGDGAATDNFLSLQAVYNFAGAYRYSPDLGGSIGGKVLLPSGSAMYCGSNGAKALQQPYGVWVQGQGSYTTVLKVCAAWSTSTNFYELCDTQSRLSCFGTMLEGVQIFAVGTQDSGINMTGAGVAVYTNSCQQQNCGIRNAIIYPGACRIGVKAEIGYGGASAVALLQDVEMKGGKSTASCNGGGANMILINYGTTQVTLNNVNISGIVSGGGGPRANGLAVIGGFVDIHSLYAENITSPLLINIPTSLANGMVRVHNIDAGASCVWLVTLAGTNTPGNFLIGGPMAVNSCSSGIVQDAQAGGTNMTSPQVSDKIFNP